MINLLLMLHARLGTNWFDQHEFLILFILMSALKLKWLKIVEARMLKEKHIIRSTELISFLVSF
uniref:Uncharacterized protein n=1 Tax=Arundo donax TaxID=35708 RepID=A0A0A9EGB0_ARUDO